MDCLSMIRIGPQNDRNAYENVPNDSYSVKIKLDIGEYGKTPTFQLQFVMGKPWLCGTPVDTQSIRCNTLKFCQNS